MLADVSFRPVSIMLPIVPLQGGCRGERIQGSIVGRYGMGRKQGLSIEEQKKKIANSLGRRKAVDGEQETRRWRQRRIHGGQRSAREIHGSYCLLVSCHVASEKKLLEQSNKTVSDQRMKFNNVTSTLTSCNEVDQKVSQNGVAVTVYRSRVSRDRSPDTTAIT